MKEIFSTPIMFLLSCIAALLPTCFTFGYITPFIRTTIARIRFSIIKNLVDWALTRNTELIRKQPFAIVLQGSPGVGKTTAALTIIKGLIPDIAIDEIVVLNEEDEFQSEFRTSHRVVILDDVCNTHSNVQKSKGSPLRRIIDFVNNVPKRALNPHLDLKGTIPIQVELVIITTNAPYLQSPIWSTCAESIYRRVLFIRPHLIKSFKGDGLQTDCWSFEITHMVKNTRGGLSANDYCDNTVNPYSPDNKKVTYKELIPLLRKKRDQHDFSQHRLVCDINNYFRRPSYIDIFRNKFLNSRFKSETRTRANIKSIVRKHRSLFEEYLNFRQDDMYNIAFVVTEDFIIVIDKTNTIKTYPLNPKGYMTCIAIESDTHRIPFSEMNCYFSSSMVLEILNSEYKSETMVTNATTVIIINQTSAIQPMTTCLKRLFLGCGNTFQALGSLFTSMAEDMSQTDTQTAVTEDTHSTVCTELVSRLSHRSHPDNVLIASASQSYDNKMGYLHDRFKKLIIDQNVTFKIMTCPSQKEEDAQIYATELFMKEHPDSILYAQEVMIDDISCDLIFKDKERLYLIEAKDSKPSKACEQARARQQALPRFITGRCTFGYYTRTNGLEWLSDTKPKISVDDSG
jgi:hypothetical protein